MATRYGGIGDTSMNDPESQDIDSDSQENYQEEHVEFDPQVALQHLTCKMEWLRQTVKDKDNDPRDAIKHLEQKLNQIAIALCPTLGVTLRRNLFRKLIITRYSHIEWK